MNSPNVKVNYTKLWVLLAERGYRRVDLYSQLGINFATMAKMNRNEPVRLDTLFRICKLFDVDIGDVCSFKCITARDKERTRKADSYKVAIKYARRNK